MITGPSHPRPNSPDQILITGQGWRIAWRGLLARIPMDSYAWQQLYKAIYIYILIQ